MSLPNETLCSILDGLSPQLLASLALVSRRFNAVAERLLYSSIQIRDTLSERCPKPWRTIRWSRSILRRAHLMETTKTVSIRWQTDNDFPPLRLSLSEESASLSQALRSLPFLEYLEIALWLVPVVSPNPIVNSNASYAHPIERIIRDCSFPHLQYCSLFADYPGIASVKSTNSQSSGESDVLARFLCSVPCLQNLKVFLPHPEYSGHVTLDVPIPSTALIHLKSFRGSPSLAAVILPGRPVNSLSLVGREEEVTIAVIAMIAQTRETLHNQIAMLPGVVDVHHMTAPFHVQSLKALDLSNISIRPMLLRNIAIYLPQIESLRVKLGLRHTLHYAMSGIRLLAGLSSVLASFPHLAYLDLSPTSVFQVASPTTSTSQQYGGGNIEEELALCQEWCRSSSCLTHIDFPSRRRWYLDGDGEWHPRDFVIRV